MPSTGGFASVGEGETVWRLIAQSWYQPDVTGRKVIQEAAFVGQVSLLRELLVSQHHVDAAKNGKFMKYGIARLPIAEIRRLTGGDVRIDPDPDWPRESHVLFIRNSGGKTLRLTHPEVSVLTNLANQIPLLREPQP
jgi:hypothetical protein